MNDRERGAAIGRAIRRGGDVSSLVFVHLAQGEVFNDVTVTEHAELFADWRFGVSYTEKSIARHGGALYRCIQAHTSQTDWAPDSAASLWVKLGDPAEEWPMWSQPIGAHDAYGLGATVTFDGRRWTSAVSGNVWQPGVYGWDEVPGGAS
ncbi:MAG: alpha-amylase [Oscillospiraceae bacterium]|jgi:hypothetical protein|nr:alpha-amylase [Oscillospiraceae bacterium]